MWIVSMFAISLALTLVIETAVAAAFGVRLLGLKVVWLVNTLTNPAAVCAIWLLKQRFFTVSDLWIQIPVEAAVILVEALIYRSFAKDPVWRLRRPVLLAVTANLVSWGTGLVLGRVL